jgi:hypothetical protein
MSPTPSLLISLSLLRHPVSDAKNQQLSMDGRNAYDDEDQGPVGVGVRKKFPASVTVLGEFRDYIYRYGPRMVIELMNFIRQVGG